MSTFVVEQAVVASAVADLGAELSALRGIATAMTANGQPVRVLHATYVPTHQTCVCVVDAADAATVLEALRRAGTHTARVLPALDL
jgi:hypothetical protein